MPIHLESPLSLAGQTLRSRLWCGPAALPGLDDPAALARIAAGHTAVVMLPVVVAPGGRWRHDLAVLDDDRAVPALATRLTAIATQGAVPLVELGHGGGRSGDLLDDRPRSWSDRPDAVNGRRPAPLSVVERRALLQTYLAAARRARQAGARLLGLAVDDDQLPQDALSPRSQPPGAQDSPGADWLSELVAALSAGGPVVVRLCAEELVPGGLSASAGIQAARAIVAAGAVGLVVSAGGRGLRALQRPFAPPGPLREGAHARLAGWVRAAVAVPVGTVGGLRSRAAIDHLLDAGVIDFAVLERPYRCQPELGRAIGAGNWEARCSSQLDCLGAASPAAAAACCAAARAGVAEEELP